VVVKNWPVEGTEKRPPHQIAAGKGGRVQDVSYSDITMTNVIRPFPSCVIIRDSSQAKYPKNDPAQPMTDTTPLVRNIHIAN